MQDSCIKIINSTKKENEPFVFASSQQKKKNRLKPKDKLITETERKS